MLEGLPILKNLSDKEISVLEDLAGEETRARLNGMSREWEISILKKTGFPSIEKLIYALHVSLLRSRDDPRATMNTVGRLLNDSCLYGN